MKVWLLLALASAGLASCASIADNGSPASNMVGMVTDAVSPGAREQYRAQQDDVKCRDFGHQPQTEGYARCRMELEKLHAGSRPIQVQVQ